MSSVFNSLGSNYSLHFVLLSLWNVVFSRQNDVQKLENYLSKRYDGHAVALYKGRDAIELVCRVLLQPGDAVLTQAFSCFAVEEGITRAGMKPVYVDIAPGDTNMNVQTLTSALKKHPNARAVLVQHSLGISADSVAIAAWCKKNNLLLIEDLAQGIGGQCSDGEDLGTYADAIIHSFGRDKIVDATAGGAAVFKKLTKPQRTILKRINLEQVAYKIVCGDLVYPALTYSIRKTHHIGVGKLLFFIFKRLGLLGSPIVSKTAVMKQLHPAYVALIMHQFRNLDAQLSHRKQISDIYASYLQDSTAVSVLSTVRKRAVSSNLRFSFTTSNVTRVVDHLKQNRIYIPDRWYRSAVDCGSFLCESEYISGSCPNAEALAKSVINLPTHKAVSALTAQRISEILVEVL